MKALLAVVLSAVLMGLSLSPQAQTNTIVISDNPDNRFLGVVEGGFGLPCALVWWEEYEALNCYNPNDGWVYYGYAEDPVGRLLLDRPDNWPVQGIDDDIYLESQLFGSADFDNNGLQDSVTTQRNGEIWMHLR